MSLLRAFLVRLRSLVRHDLVEGELDEELRYHLERESERNVSRGMDPQDAQHAARRAFGNVEYLKEQSRDARGWPRLEHVIRDLGAGLRLARKQPGFAAVIVLSLALGTGATNAIFNLTYNVLLAQLDVPHPDQLAALIRIGDKEADVAFTWNEYQVLKTTPNVGTFAAVRTASQIAVATGDRREYVNMHFVAGEFFPLLGLRPRRGRLLTPADDRQRFPAAVLSERFAQTLFPGDDAVVGKTVAIRGIPFTVVGITPRSFRGLEFPGQFTVAIPLSTLSLLANTGPRDDDRGNPLDLGATSNTTRRAYRIVGRLAIDRAPASAALALTFDRCCANHERLAVQDIRRGIPGGKADFRNVVGTILLILLAVMALVLVVVCTNIASLLLVRTAARQREIAVRLSLGASRGRVVAQLLLESLPLALLGGGLGLLVAAWTTWLIVTAVPEADDFLEMFSFRPHPLVLLFAGSIAVLCGLAFAVYPALRATRGDLAPALGQGGRASVGRQQGTVARGVVVAQVAITVVLVIAATLFLVTLRNLGRVDGGFATDRVLLVLLETRGTPYEQQGVGPLHERLLEQVGGLPGTRGVALASMIPMYGGNFSWMEVQVPGYESPTGERPSVRLDAVVPGYLATLGIPLARGRDFTRTDGPRTGPVALVSAAFAQRFFGASEPVGRSFGATLHGDSLTSVRVVGVVADAKYSSPRQAPEPLVYLPLAQTATGWTNLSLAVRTVGAPATLVPAVRRAIDAAAPGIRIRRVSEMRAQLDVATTIERLAAAMAGFAGLLAVALSMMGLYGVVAHSVARRTRELGIRRALGAPSASIVGLVLRDIAGIVSAGMLLGLVVSSGANGLIRSQLFGVSAHDPGATLLSILILAAAALVAAAVPAWRAVRIDPRIALIAE